MYIILISLLITLSTVHAFPNGAPFCTTGEAAPGSPHKRNFTNPRTGPLSDGGFIVTVGGTTLSTTVPLTVFSLRDIPVVATSVAGNKTFKGVLIIISSTTFNFTNGVELKPVGSDVQVIGDCNMTGKAGFTHNSNITKTAANGTLNFPGNISDVKLDVNIVVSNNAIEGSVYYYTQFTLIVVKEPPPIPVPVPVRPPVPVPLPVTAPVPVPVKPPTRKPCGLFRQSIFCPFTFCGFIGRFLFGSENC